MVLYILLSVTNNSDDMISECLYDDYDAEYDNSLIIALSVVYNPLVSKRERKSKLSKLFMISQYTRHNFE
jgi:hypothetical protein